MEINVPFTQIFVKMLKDTFKLGHNSNVMLYFSVLNKLMVSVNVLPVVVVYEHIMLFNYVSFVFPFKDGLYRADAKLYSEITVSSIHVRLGWCSHILLKKAPKIFIFDF